MPDWLLNLVRGQARRSTRAAGDWRHFVAEVVPEGGRNDAVASLAGTLLRRRVDPLLTLDLLQAWNAATCRPPLSSEEVERTVRSIASCEIARRRRAHG